MQTNTQLINVESVYSEIVTILRAKARKSENTAKIYYDDFKQFCNDSLHISIEEITEEDLRKITPKRLMEYQEYLCSRYAGATVNRKINAIRSIFKKLAADPQRNLHVDIFNVLDAVECDTKHNGVLTLSETLKMIELAKELRNGEEKSLIIELAAQTGIRLSAIMGATWSEFSNVDGIWVFSTTEKKEKRNKVVERPIPNDLYERLLTLKRDGVETVFSIDKRTMQRVVPDLATKMGIPAERKITFHSLKKMGINYILEKTGDVNQAAQFANHESIQTAYNSYFEKHNKDFASMPSYTMLQQLDLSPLEELSREELLNLIMQCKDSTKIDILSRV